VEEALARASPVVRHADPHAAGQNDNEVGAALCSTAVEASTLDQMITVPEARLGTLQPFWNARPEA